MARITKLRPTLSLNSISPVATPNDKVSKEQLNGTYLNLERTHFLSLALSDMFYETKLRLVYGRNLSTPAAVASVAFLSSVTFHNNGTRAAPRYLKKVA